MGLTDRLVGEVANAAGALGPLNDVENILPDQVTDLTDEVFRTLDRTVGPDPFDQVKPAMLEADDPILHVANRAAYGPTPSLVDEIRALGGAQPWLQWQLRPDRIDDSDAEQRLASFTLLDRSAKRLRDNPLVRYSTLRNELRAATLLRAAWSRRQLLEVMTQFWSEHFSVSIEAGRVIWHKPREDRAVIRRYAMASFDDLLMADAGSPAMLLYLDQSSSRAPNVNENYARELLELHTVGLNGGYTEADVRHTAYALAGWTVDPHTHTFRFRDDWADDRPLQVMGWSHPGGASVQRGRSLLRYLAHHPATARRVARKLAVRFVGEKPSAALVAQLAAVYSSHNTAIVPVLESLFSSDEFWASTAQRLRRPHEQLVAWLRVLTPRVDIRRGGGSPAATSLEWTSRMLGHAPFGWPAPNGFPEAAQYWSATALVAERWSTASRLVRNRLQGIEVDIPRMVAGAATVGDAIDMLAARLTSRRPTAAERSALEAFAGGPSRQLEELHADELAHLAQLVLVLPSAQWH